MTADEAPSTKSEGPAAAVRLLYPPAGGRHGATLAEVSRAFNRGDFGSAGRLSREVLAAADHTAEERDFAAQMAQRTAPDPLAWLIGGVALSLLVVTAVVGIHW